MGVVFVTGDGPEHRYVANTINATHDLDAVLICEATKRRSWHSVLRKSPIQFIDKAAREIFLRAVGDKTQRYQSLKHVLGAKVDHFEREDIITRVGTPKEGILAEKISQLAPDIIAIYGTGIIPDNVLGLAGKIALNMHTGLSPWYRGVACSFWPIVDKKPEMVGATVHECIDSVDGGRIFFRQRAPLYKGDDLHAIFARSVAIGASGYVRVISQALAGQLTGRPQDLQIGKEFRGNMLGIRAEITGRWALRRISRDWGPPPIDQR